MNTAAVTLGLGDRSPASSELSAAASRYWRAIAQVLESRTDDLTSIVAQGLGPFAAELFEQRGRAVPEVLLRPHRLARVAEVTAPNILARVRDACEGPILVLKGPEAAARYPGRARASGDLDLLVPDAANGQRRRLAAGFAELHDHDGRWVGIQHFNPLVWPGTPLVVEIHSVPKWPTDSEPPRVEELVERAVRSATGVPGVLAPAPVDHAVLLAVHAWAHQPLGRARDLVDVGAFRADADSEEIARAARTWDVLPLWRTTIQALDAFLEGRRTLPLRLWAAHLAELRDQTVFEAHLERILAPFWGLPLGRAARRSGAALLAELRPAFDEGWSEKLRRTTIALRRPSASVKAHRDMLGDSARRGQGRSKPPVDDGS